MEDTRAVALLHLVIRLYPGVLPTLNAADPFQILIAVLLSAQTTDVAVNAVTPKLFAAYPTPAAMAAATPQAIEPYIDRLGLYRNKAKYLQALSQALVDHYDGAVPRDFKALVSLPGVGPKTATVVRTDAFNIPGVAVDTHVSRIIKGFGIAPQSATPTQIQHRLEALMPETTWINLHRALIRLGREWLTARAPQLPPGPEWAAYARDYAPLNDQNTLKEAPHD
ncbi:endonuclease III domain-containing protein [Lacticaseibacillus daqingensis]|uniref:endonuclease III domain-containing protein n=1 Tax=Lacticaseibacillus daqingensis TaxID=2486014 RepID=UPI000F7A7814|nr:endonuclease III [Lacticaseibacillus daqingensis]